MKFISRWFEDRRIINRPEKIANLKREVARAVAQVRAVEEYGKGNTAILQRFGKRGESLIRELKRNPDLLSSLRERKEALIAELRKEGDLRALDLERGYFPRKKRKKNFVAIVLDRAQRLLAGLTVISILLVPTWLFIAARFWLSPEGFWQNLALTGIGLWFLGGIQLLILVVALSLWLDS